MKLSIVISAYNEEKKIEDCLKSVKFADEIIVVNSGSTDKTLEIAKKYTSKIFNRDNEPMLNINKNYGFSKATGDWILSLDADERISPELAEEIKSITEEKDNKQIIGYWIPRKNIIFGKWIQHAGWYPDNQLRLFKKEKGEFEEKHVHEMIKIEGSTGCLKSDIIHYNFETIQQFLHKHLNIYAPNEAKDLTRNKYEFNYLDAIRFPSKEFLSRFFAREGYKDGLHGLMLCLFMAFYHFVIFAYLWEGQGFKEIGDKNFETEIQEEFKKKHREITFWFFEKKIKSTKNIFNKLWLKAQRKLS